MHQIDESVAMAATSNQQICENNTNVTNASIATTTSSDKSIPRAQNPTFANNFSDKCSEHDKSKSLIAENDTSLPFVIRKFILKRYLRFVVHFLSYRKLNSIFKQHRLHT